MRGRYVSKRAKLGKNVIVGNNVTLYGDCQISDNCIIGDNVTIGFPSKEEFELRKSCRSQKIDSISKNPTIIGYGTRVLSNSVIYSGVEIGEGTEILEHTRIGPRTTVGKSCRVRYGAQIYADVSIGDNCVVAGFCCSRAKIGTDCTMMGNMVHKYDRGWIDGLKEDSPVLAEHVIVGYNALLVGNIRISKYVYVGAGAVVTKDIPSRSIVIGNCEIYDARQWRGRIDLRGIFSLGEDQSFE